MYIERDGNKWWINRGPSPFTSRQGLEDVGIYKKSAWGRRQADGSLYKCCKRMAAESGEIIRDYEPVPSELTVEWLSQAGFIDRPSP